MNKILKVSLLLFATMLLLAGCDNNKENIIDSTADNRGSIENINSDEKNNEDNGNNNKTNMGISISDSGKTKTFLLSQISAEKQAVNKVLLDKKIAENGLSEENFVKVEHLENADVYTYANDNYIYVFTGEENNFKTKKVSKSNTSTENGDMWVDGTVVHIGKNGVSAREFDLSTLPESQVSNEYSIGNYTIIFPDSWAGKYNVEKSENNVLFNGTEYVFKYSSEEFVCWENNREHTFDVMAFVNVSDKDTFYKENGDDILKNNKYLSKKIFEDNNVVISVIFTNITKYFEGMSDTEELFAMMNDATKDNAVSVSLR